jgi:quercetin dioxygenase-like cupin family protein
VRSPIINLVAILAIAACSKDAQTSANAPSAPTTSARASAAPGQSNSAQQDVQWSPAPPVFPPGAEIAILQGDLSKAEPFTLRLRFPNGYKIPPHTHPTTENVTVLTGTFLAGMGTQFDESQMRAFSRDEFISVPAEHAHYAMARGLTVIQLHGIGPVAITYVNPADAQAFR